MVYRWPNNVLRSKARQALVRVKTKEGGGVAEVPEVPQAKHSSVRWTIAAKRGLVSLASSLPQTGCAGGAYAITLMT